MYIRMDISCDRERVGDMSPPPSGLVHVINSMLCEGDEGSNLHNSAAAAGVDGSLMKLYVATVLLSSY